MSHRGYFLAKAGRAADAKDVINTLQAASRERYVPPAAIALIHLGLGDREETFAWLERAYQERDVHLIFLPVDPKWDAVSTSRPAVDLGARGRTASQTI